jgi:hypothetical protein
MPDNYGTNTDIRSVYEATYTFRPLHQHGLGKRKTQQDSSRHQTGVKARNIWSTALYGAKTWTLKEVDQK